MKYSHSTSLFWSNCWYYSSSAHVDRSHRNSSGFPISIPASFLSRSTSINANQLPELKALAPCRHFNFIEEDKSSLDSEEHRPESSNVVFKSTRLQMPSQATRWRMRAAWWVAQCFKHHSVICSGMNQSIRLNPFDWTKSAMQWNALIRMQKGVPANKFMYMRRFLLQIMKIALTLPWYCINSKAFFADLKYV